MTAVAPGAADRRPSRVISVDAGSDLTAAAAADVRADVTAAVEESAQSSYGPGGVVHLLLPGVVRHDVVGLGLLLRLHRAARGVGVQLVCVDPPASLLTAMRRHGLHRVLAVDVALPSPDPADPRSASRHQPAPPRPDRV